MGRPLLGLETCGITPLAFTYQSSRARGTGIWWLKVDIELEITQRSLDANGEIRLH